MHLHNFLSRDPGTKPPGPEPRLVGPFGCCLTAKFLVFLFCKDPKRLTQEVAHCAVGPASEHGKDSVLGGAERFSSFSRSHSWEGTMLGPQSALRTHKSVLFLRKEASAIPPSPAVYCAPPNSHTHTHSPWADLAKTETGYDCKQDPEASQRPADCNLGPPSAGPGSLPTPSFHKHLGEGALLQTDAALPS